MKTSSDRGAVAVEFALLLPMLLIVLLGILEFGRIYNAQITLTQSAREGVRVMAIQNDAALARTSTIQAAVSLETALLAIDIETRDPAFNGPVTPDQCLPEQQVTVTVAYELPSLTGFFAPLELTGRGVMRCGG